MRPTHMERICKLLHFHLTISYVLQHTHTYIKDYNTLHSPHAHKCLLCTMHPGIDNTRQKVNKRTDPSNVWSFLFPFHFLDATTISTSPIDLLSLIVVLSILYDAFLHRFICNPHLFRSTLAFSYFSCYYNLDTFYYGIIYCPVIF